MGGPRSPQSRELKTGEGVTRLMMQIFFNRWGSIYVCVCVDMYAVLLY